MREATSGLPATAVPQSGRLGYWPTAGAPVGAGERVLVGAGPTGEALARVVDPLLPARDQRIAMLLLTGWSPTNSGVSSPATDQITSGG